MQPGLAAAAAAAAVTDHAMFVTLTTASYSIIDAKSYLMQSLH
jgi:hypothetical protein